MQSVEHAINYATAYLTGGGKSRKKELELPEWVLNYQGNLRRFSTSRGLCPANNRPRRYQVKSRTSRKCRPIADRLADCGKETKLIELKEVQGGKRFRFVRSFKVPYREEFREGGDDVLRKLVAEERKLFPGTSKSKVMCVSVLANQVSSACDRRWLLGVQNIEC